ncbi:protein YIPF [Chloropicon primus]|nr:protein YIPF [Chloropicon primus]
MTSKGDEINVNLMDMQEGPSSSVMEDPFAQLGDLDEGGWGSMDPGLDAAGASVPEESPFVSLDQGAGQMGPGPVPLPDLSAATTTTTTTTTAGADPFASSNDVEVNLLMDSAPGGGSGDDGNKAENKGSDDKAKVTWNPLVFLKNRLEPYFDVDTDDIVQRTLQAIVKGYKGKFTEFTADKPDLYGPFWIATTLIVVSSASGSFAQYLSGVSKNDMDKVTASAFFFYGYVTLLPLAIWGLLIYHKKPMRLLNIVDVYGYAMSVFIPTAILCTVPNTIMRWSLILLAAAVSGLSIVMNVKQNFMEALQGKGALYLSGIAAIHLGLAIGLKFYFFLY